MSSLQERLGQLDAQKAQLIQNNRIATFREHGFEDWKDHDCKHCGKPYIIHDDRVTCPRCHHSFSTFTLQSYFCDLCGKLIREEIMDIGRGYGSHSHRVQAFNHRNAMFRDYDKVWKPLKWGDTWKATACFTCFNKNNFATRIKRRDLNMAIDDQKKKLKQELREKKRLEKKIQKIDEDKVPKILAKIDALREEKKQLGSTKRT